MLRKVLLGFVEHLGMLKFGFCFLSRYTAIKCYLWIVLNFSWLILHSCLWLIALLLRLRRFQPALSLLTVTVPACSCCLIDPLQWVGSSPNYYFCSRGWVDLCQSIVCLKTGLVLAWTNPVRETGVSWFMPEHFLLQYELRFFKILVRYWSPLSERRVLVASWGGKWTVPW